MRKTRIGKWLAVLTVLCLALSLFPAALAAESEDVLLSGLDKSDALSWKDDAVTVTPVSDAAFENGSALRLSMAEKDNWKGLTIPLPQAGALADKEAVTFYLETPDTGAKENCWFQIFYEYTGVQITHAGDFKIYLKKNGTDTWEETDYWNGYGPNIPYGFKGLVKIPLTGALRVSYTSTGEADPKPELAESILLFFSNFGGENGDICLDALKAVPKPGQDPDPEPEPEDPLLVLFDFEKYEVGTSLKNDKNTPNGPVVFTGAARDFDAVVSDAAFGDGKKSLQVNSAIEQNFAQLLLTLNTPMHKDTRSVIMYVRAPQVSAEEEFNFSFAALVPGGDYKMKDTNVRIMRRGTKTWESVKYFADWGANLGGSFEGFIQFDLADMIPAWSSDPNAPIPEKILPQTVTQFGFWFHNFGGDEAEVSAFHLDTLVANAGEPEAEEFLALVAPEFFKTPEDKPDPGTSDGSGTSSGSGEWSGDEDDDSKTDPTPGRDDDGKSDDGKSDDGGTVKTGQDMTVVFAVLALGMLACAAVLAAKKRVN